MTERKICGRVVNPEEFNGLAPSYQIETLKITAKEYSVGAMIGTIEYLISNEPIDEGFWLGVAESVGYGNLPFIYKGKEEIIFTNNGSARCMKEVLSGKLDISDWILDLTILSAGTFRSKKEWEEFHNEIQEKVRKGITKKVISK